MLHMLPQNGLGDRISVLCVWRVHRASSSRNERLKSTTRWSTSSFDHKCLSTFDNYLNTIESYWKSRSSLVRSESEFIRLPEMQLGHILSSPPRFWLVANLEPFLLQKQELFLAGKMSRVLGLEIRHTRWCGGWIIVAHESILNAGDSHDKH